VSTSDAGADEGQTEGGDLRQRTKTDEEKDLRVPALRRR